MNDTRLKFPRTYHLPWSEGVTKDDKVLKSLHQFRGRCIWKTEKVDGECTSMDRDGAWARSLDSKGREDRDWLMNFWSKRQHLLQKGFRICGENMYAKHSIYYTELESYFLGHSAWDGDTRLSRADTLVLFQELGIAPVKTQFTGMWDEKYLRSFVAGHNEEGYVVTLIEGFKHEDYDKYVGKFVRECHVQTGKHWSQEKLVKNLRRPDFDPTVN